MSRGWLLAAYSRLRRCHAVAAAITAATSDNLQRAAHAARMMTRYALLLCCRQQTASHGGRVRATSAVTVTEQAMRISRRHG